MTEAPLQILERWEAHGAVWRTRSLAEGQAIVDLLTCYGEPVDEVRSEDPELLRYLAGRRTSEDPP
jgi:hypothetical protein